MKPLDPLPGNATDVGSPTRDQAHLVEVSGTLPWYLVPLGTEVIVSLRNITYRGQVAYVDASGLDLVLNVPLYSVCIPWESIKHIGFLG